MYLYNCVFNCKLPRMVDWSRLNWALSSPPFVKKLSTPPFDSPWDIDSIDKVKGLYNAKSTNITLNCNNELLD